MKFTSEDLMKAMRLQVGDRVKVDRYPDVIYVVTEDYKLKKLDSNLTFGFSILINTEYEILPRPKRVGDLKCSRFNTCKDCPIQFICNLYDCSFSEDNSLYNILTEIDVCDQEIYDLLKARLDKEVVEK